MKRGIIALISLLAVSLFAGCNMPNNNQQQTQTNTGDNQQQSKTNTGDNQQQSKTNTGDDQQQTQTNNEFLKQDNVTIYIDKNCEDSQVPQCQSDEWKKQFIQILGKEKLDIKYIDQTNMTYLKKVASTTPVMAIPENKLPLFGQQAEGIKQQAKLSDGSYYIPLFGWIAGEENMCNDGKDNNGDGKMDGQDASCLKMDVISSSKCKEQYCNEQALKSMFMGYNINILDINKEKGKKIYEELKKTNGEQTLPTFLFNEKKDYIDKMQQFVKENKGGYKYQLNIPQFKYDPSIEACATNCNASPSCKKLLSCAKTDKPNVELFVMSYCPYGTQAEKGILGALNALRGKIISKIEFVNYVMHGQKEVDENSLQYCVQEKEPTKYNTYLTCFLEKGDSKDCQTKAKLNMNLINKCIKNVSNNLGKYPAYKIYDEENKKYGVQGSPTLVINGVKVQPESRSPQAYLKAICSAFKNPPVECKKVLSNQSYDPMWGWTQNGQSAPAGSCGGK